jgi:hypothetical protein
MHMHLFWNVLLLIPILSQGNITLLCFIEHIININEVMIKERRRRTIEPWFVSAGRPIWQWRRMHAWDGSLKQLRVKSERCLMHRVARSRSIWWQSTTLDREYVAIETRESRQKSMDHVRSSRCILLHAYAFLYLGGRGRPMQATRAASFRMHIHVSLDPWTVLHARVLQRQVGHPKIRACRCM